MNNTVIDSKISDFSIFFTFFIFTSPIFTSYKKILVPHDGSEMSDEILRHVIYKICSAEIVIINIIKHDAVPPSTLL